jgi:hypothetical protein
MIEAELLNKVATRWDERYMKEADHLLDKAVETGDSYWYGVRNGLIRGRSFMIETLSEILREVNNA